MRLSYWCLFQESVPHLSGLSEEQDSVVLFEPET